MISVDKAIEIFAVFREDARSNAIMETEEDIKIFNDLMVKLGIKNYRIGKVGDIAPMWTKRGKSSPAAWRKLLDNSLHRTIDTPIKENNHAMR